MLNLQHCKHLNQAASQKEKVMETHTQTCAHTLTYIMNTYHGSHTLTPTTEYMNERNTMRIHLKRGPDTSLGTMISLLWTEQTRNISTSRLTSPEVLKASAQASPWEPTLGQCGQPSPLHLHPEDHPFRLLLELHRLQCRSSESLTQTTNNESHSRSPRQTDSAALERRSHLLLSETLR